jgi:type IV fimbrial biogenesis protein FimT
MQRKGLGGYTIIELMVTLAVAAVLVGLAVPSFRDLIEKSRLRGATDDLVNLLNTSRSSAVKLGLDVNASVTITSSTNWCAGAVSATDPESSSSTIGQAAASASACDCTSATACIIAGIVNGSSTSAGQTSLVSSTSYSGVQLSSGSTNTLLQGVGGVVFNSKYGALDFSSLSTLSPLTVTSSSGKYQTQITMSALGQTYVCTPSSSKFVSGYPSC